MNKRGQFFLIAALVIIGVIAGLTTVYNVTKISEEDLAVYDLTSELNFEGSQVLASGVFNDFSDNKIVENIEQLIEFYAQSNPDSEFVGIYGNETTITLIVYRTETDGSISIILGEGGSTFPISGTTRGIIETFSRPSEGIVIIEIDGEVFTFDLRPGQTLYIIVEKESEGERFVATPG